MPKEFKVTKMPYMKFLSKYFRMAANLDEKQEAALFELLAHKMGEPCGKRTVEELLEDVPTKIVFDIICDDIDQCSEAYSNTCVTNRENGKKGGAPKGNQNARKKKRPKPEQEPEEVAENLTDEAEPVPDPDPEPDREPEPKPFAILKPIERRAAEIVLHENDFDFLDRFDTKQLNELFAFAVLSEYSPGELAAAAHEADSVLNAAREKAESLYKSRNEEKWFIPEFAFILDKLNELRQLPAEELETACKKYDERTETA